MILQPMIDKLDERFAGVPIHPARVPQGLQLPCFFVRIVKTNLDPQMGNFYFLRNLLSITYMSDIENMSDAGRWKVLEDVRFKMLFALRQIPTLKGVEGYNLQAEIQGSDIVLFGNYDLFVEMVQEKEPYMKVLNDDYFTNEHITLNDINKDLHPELYKPPVERDYNTVEDLRDKGVDGSIIDYIERDLMRQFKGVKKI